MQWNFLSWIFWFCALSCIHHLPPCWFASSSMQSAHALLHKPHFQAFPDLCILFHICTSAPSVETLICLLLGYKLPSHSSVVWVLTCHICKCLLTPALIVTVEDTTLGKYCLPSNCSLIVLQLHSLYHPALPYVMACKGDHEEIRSTSCQWNETFLFPSHHVFLKYFCSTGSIKIQAFLYE